MPPAIGLVVFDSAVDLGLRRSTRLLQRALGVEVDGVPGPVTLDALHRADMRALVDEFLARRAVHYASLKKAFHLGWYRRVMDIHRRAGAGAHGVAEQPDRLTRKAVPIETALLFRKRSNR